MSATAPPFSRADATPQSIQQLLDENAQLIRALVENMNVKGKSMECVQYQQTLHRNLVYLATLADPSVNVQALLPPPGTTLMQSQRVPVSQPQATTSNPYSAAANMSPVQQQPSTQPPRQPQANMPTSSQLYQWSSAASQSVAPGSMSMAVSRGSQPPLPQMMQGHNIMVSSNGGMPMKGYGGSMWVGGGGAPAGQMGVYGMGQRVGLPMGNIPDERRRQLLRIQQEQMIQAQHARRIAAQQQQQGAMYHGPGMMPGAGPPGMPPGYSQSSAMGVAVRPPPHAHWSSEHADLPDY